MSTSDRASTILITGGAGFVGSSLCLHLRKTKPKCKVIAFDNLKRRGSELNLPRLKSAGVEFIHGDVRNRSDLDALPISDALIECSAEPSVLAGMGEGADYVVDTNLGGTINCLRLAAKTRTDVLFLSTSRVYPIDQLNGACRDNGEKFEIHPAASVPGISPQGVNETFPLNGVRTLYGATKLASELLIQEYAHQYGFRAVVNRCGVLAGPWQMGKTDQGFALLWLSRHHWNLPLSYIGYGGIGKQVRDLLHVQDLCDLVTWQLDHMERMAGRTFNVGGGVSNAASLKEFTALCREVTGRSTRIDAVTQERPGDLKLYISDNSEVIRSTGWKPKRDLRTILSDSYDWLKEHDVELRDIMS